MLVRFFWLPIILFSWSVQTEEISCPANSSLVDYQSDISGKRMLFCQTTKNGQIVKHGLYMEYSREGEVIVRKNFEFGKEVGFKAAVKKKEKKNINGRLDQVFEKIAKELLNINPGKRIYIFKNRDDLCQDNPQKRLMFLIKGVSYKQLNKFRKNCPFKGVRTYKMNTLVPVDLEVKDFLEYNLLRFTYKMTKNKKGNSLVFKTDITEGELISPSGKLKFRCEGVFKIDPARVMSTRGRGGVTIQSGYVEFLEADGKAINYRKDI